MRCKSPFTLWLGLNPFIIPIWVLGSVARRGVSSHLMIDLGARIFQMGSLAGAARMWNDSACDLSVTQREQKSHVELKGKSYIYWVLQCGNQTWKWGLSILLSLEGYILKFKTRGVRKVTTGITGLWQPRVHIDVAFWSFDVRLFLSLIRRRIKVLDCSPIQRERELGLDRRETG